MTATAATLAPAGLAPAERRDDAQPARARGIQLLGALGASGYREPPTLVRRSDGQLVKLTKLLYELLEAIDGRRGDEELAAELSRRAGREATADDVRFLIERKLRPLGLLQEAGGREPQVARANPLLVLRPRFVISRPGLTRALTAPFLWLFHPAVMIPLLIAFAATSAWLLVEHGLASALHQAFHEPGLILVVWALVVLSAAFHEIGHATACRYGGARPGVIGGGLYLVWPAFYTEVSDSYRLDRRGRLRVDLGGLYFSAIFAVATVGLWRLTRADALLLVIAVQLLQMVRQLVPFIRADGYHIVADLVGVPDLFAHIKPTLLGMLPARLGRPQHKVLKPWARAVVTGWVLTTVPALVLVIGLIVLAFPRVAATAWDSLGLRWAETTTHWSSGDAAGLAVSAGSIVLVALPVLSIVYLVSYLGHRMAVKAWRDTAGRPGMRALATLAAGAVVGLIAWAWWPGDQYRPVDRNERGPVPTIVDVAARGQAPETHRVLLSAPASSAIRSPALIARPAPLLGLAPRIGPAVGPPPGNAPPTRVDLPPKAPLPPGRSGLPDRAGAPTPLRVGAQPLGAADGSAWPFPFAPPDLPRPGDNRAMAVNLTDGSTLWVFEVSMLTSEGGAPVLQANEAHAYASCRDCRTGAVAFQLILIVGQANEIAPVNAAVAANYDCVSCDTYAFAYQVVVTVTAAPSADLQRQLELVLDRLRELEANAGSLPPAEILAALEQARLDVLTAIEDIVAGNEPAPAGSQEASEAHDGEQEESSSPSAPSGDPPAELSGSSDTEDADDSADDGEETGSTTDADAGTEDEGQEPLPEAESAPTTDCEAVEAEVPESCSDAAADSTTR